MSSGGQIAGGIVGGIVGFFNPVIGVAIGAQVGMLVGGLLDPPKGPTVVGPRLSDLTIQTSTYGAVIPRVYGTVPIYGNVFWLENNRIYETVVKKKSGGKGGSKTKTKTYVNYATFAVGLCKGPIVGVKRIWIKGELFYDAGSSDPATVAASNTAATGFSVYPGTDTQLPDSRMQATLGADNTPAYRGLAYIVFYDLPLAAYGETIAGAQVKVEVLQLGTEQNYAATYGTMPARAWKYAAWTGSEYLVFRSPSSHIARSYDLVTWTESVPSFSSATLVGMVQTTESIILVSSSNLYRSTNNGITWTTIAVPGGASATAIGYDGDKLLMAGTGGFSALKLWISEDDGVSWAEQAAPDLTYSSSYGLVIHNGSRWIIVNNGVRLYTSETGLSGSWTLRETLIAGDWNYGTVLETGHVILMSIGSINNYSSIDGMTWTFNTVTNPDGMTGQGMLLANDGRVLVVSGDDGAYLWSDDIGVTWTYVDRVGSFANGPIIWTGAVFFQADSGSFGRFRTIKPYQISSSDTTLDDIVSAECLRSGLLAGDITTSSLTSAVRGYTVASAGSIRAALTPLQAAWPFDVIQKGYKIAFVPRGGSSVATIPMTDLDARGDGDSPGVQVTLSREMDTQLPRRLVIKHLDYDREFDQGEQYAERLNTDAVNIETQELPIVLTAAEAAGKAEVLLYVRWLERFDLSFSLPPTYINLEPADVITLETPEGNVSVRLSAINYTSDGRLECKGKYASQAIYTPAALGVVSAVTGPATITSSGSSTYILLDVPYLHTAQADPCFLAAMYGGTGWPGGVLVRTDDSGTTWTDIQGFDAPGSDVGAATNTIGLVDYTTWDKASVLNVTMLNGSLSSVTDLAVLNGENYFAYGDYGRWEIIGVQTCTLLAANQYQLTDMLRGRAGTEWAMGLHQIGDKVVSLSLTDVTAIGMSSATIGASREYRGITDGNDIDTDTDFPFAYAGVNLECLSPVFVRGSKTVSSGDWTITWVRRSRTDGEWRDKVDAGLGETTEAYEVDIFSDGTFATVKRTITSATQSCTYTSAQQTTDFGGNQSTVYAKVYQLSSIVGRGYAATATIT